MERLVGRLEAGQLALQTALDAFRLDMQATLQNHRNEFKELLQEQRERHHQQNNMLQRVLGEVDLKIIQIEQRLGKIEYSQAESRGTTNANKAWLAGLSSLVSAIVSAVVSGIMYWLSTKWG